MLLLFNETPFLRAFPWQDALAADGVDYDLWTGALADSPFVGNRSAGLRAYGAVLWDAGFETYPPVSDVQASAITAYLNNGGRLAISGHDIAWGIGALNDSPTATPARVAWLNSTLHAGFLTDLTNFTAAGYDPESVIDGESPQTGQPDPSSREVSPTGAGHDQVQANDSTPAP